VILVIVIRTSGVI